jgi:hypothetical protein
MSRKNTGRAGIPVEYPGSDDDPDVLLVPVRRSESGDFLHILGFGKELSSRHRSPLEQATDDHDGSLGIRVVDPEMIA